MTQPHRDDLLAYRPIPHACAQPLPTSGPTTREEMQSFIDGFMAAFLFPGTVAGMTVSVVRNGEIFFAKGYGLADVQARRPVDAARTLFRPGSVAKLLTWTAVMQLVEQRRLELDADVNQYLREFRIPATQSKPITLRNLMTHTPGLEDGMMGFLFAASEEQGRLPVAAWLARHLPERVRPPTTDFRSGVNASYSNWGVALAGHLVATVTGKDFDDYIDEQILAPLAMRRSTFREPLPPALAPDMSTGYQFYDGALQAKEFERIHPIGPAGSMSATAVDMARFMLAFLQGGVLDGARILSEASVQQMFARNLSPDPALNGSALGFYETWINGRRILGHAGHSEYFHSILSLMPEQGLGLFVSVNTAGAGEEIARTLEKAFVRHYFPATLPPVSPPADAALRNVRYAGRYRSLRRSYSTWEKVLAPALDVAVRAMPDGTLEFPDPAYLKPARWVEVSDGVLRRIDDDVFVAFKFGDVGLKRAGYLIGPFSPIATERIHWYQTRKTFNVIYLTAGLLFVSMLIRAAWLAGEARASVLALAGMLLLGFFLGLNRVIRSKQLTLSSVPASLRPLLALPLLATPLVMYALFASLQLWVRGEWSLAARMHYTLTALAAALVIGMLNGWNLLGYRFGRKAVASDNR